MSRSHRIKYTFINTQSKLVHIARQLEKTKRVAVDLEADSMFHFQEKVCLIQLASEKQIFVIDPLQVKNLSPLKPVFASPDIQKILHGADYDIRSLYRDFKIRIRNLLDTEIACRFIGLNATGLNAVLQMFFQVKIDKQYQRKDWSKRPLPPDMLAYAAADVKYLIPMATILETKLQAKQRLEWVGEECQILSLVKPGANSDGPLFLKCKGAGKLGPRSLAVLEALLVLRQEIARKKDKPLFKILSNKVLLGIADKKPFTLRRLQNTDLLSTRQLNMYGDDLVNGVREALKVPTQQLPTYPRMTSRRYPAGVSERIKALKEWRDKQARALQLTPSLLFPRALLADIALHKPTSFKELAQIKDLRNWQKKSFGRDILDLLHAIK